MKKKQTDNKVVYKQLSYRIVGSLFDVFNELDYGYQEKHYCKAIEKAFTEKEIKFKKQVPFKIKFKKEEIGRYFLDFLIEDKIILEIKKGNYFIKRNINQVNGYLKATGLKLAILANFTSDGIKFMRLLNIEK
ncbi:hypothetical protein BMS3Abin15_00894 [bacterium BMS3Abin15]|nr:hypothetical protein BMS3Abin15_00894 [bacterium BMS3Abin15]